MNTPEDYPDEYDRCDLYELNDKKTKFLADLSGISHDLNSTIQMCEELYVLLMLEKPHFTLIEALTTAALIKYSRCFNNASRNKILKEFLDSLPKDLRDKHTYFINLRNKFIAHSVNIFEDNYVELEVLEESNKKTLKGVTMSGVWQGGLGIPHLKDLIYLCEKLSSIVHENIFKERDRLFEYYKSIPIEDLLKSTIKKRFIPSDKDVNKIKHWKN